MKCHFSETVDLPMVAAVSATTEVLKRHGLGVLLAGAKAALG